MPAPIAFGRYTLFERFAAGGMAELFLARVRGEAGFEKPCVVKRVHSRLNDSSEFIDMFIDEARIAARLVHPGIAQIFDLGKQGDEYFIAMEYLPGENLSEVMSRARELGQPIPLDVVMKIAAAAAEALHYAHESTDAQGAPLGIVHRDVTPSNLFVTYTGAVKVLDFGIARAAQQLHQTDRRVIKGKAAYMAPEQATGQRVDRRADVWSLGVCTYELVTGEPLFPGLDRAQILQTAQEARIPSLSEARADVPEALERLVAATLERDVERRLPTARAFHEGLEALLRDRTYVSQSMQLGGFLRQLFGDARANARLSWGTVDVPASGAPKTAERETAVMRVPPSPVTRTGEGAIELVTAASTQASVRATPSRAFIGIGAIAVLIAAIVVAYWVGARRVEPPRSVVAAPPVAAADSAATRGPIVTAAPQVETSPDASASPEPTPVNEARPAQSEPASLTLDTNVAVTVFLDGARLGAAPLKRARIAAGEHTLRLENKHQGLSRTVHLTAEPGRELVRHEMFQKGFLHVSVDPWADVWLDGVKLGQTPLVREVWEGHHAVTLRGPGAPKSLAVDVSSAKPTVIDERL